MFHLWHSKARLSILELRLMEFYNFYNSIVFIFSLSFHRSKIPPPQKFPPRITRLRRQGDPNWIWGRLWGSVNTRDSEAIKWRARTTSSVKPREGEKEREERRQKEGRRRRIETGLGEKYKVATRKRGGGGIKNFNNTFPRPAGATRGKLYSTIPCSFPGDCPSFIK